MTRINTNVQSLVAQRSLTANNAALNQSIQRLSTGLRINSGKDDPAGLIASETLRSDLRAIDAAIDNATRADTIVAIAEGGLQEINSLLLELEELVDRTANEAGLTNDEVAANQLQIDSILASINRIADSVAFGDKKLLDGTFDFTTSGTTVNEATGQPVNHFNNIEIHSAKIPSGTFRQVTVNVLQPSTVGLLSSVLGGIDGTGALTGALGNSTTLQIRGNLGSEILSFASGTTAADMATAINASKELTGVSATASAAAGGPASLIFQSTTFGSDAFVSVNILENEGTGYNDAMQIDTTQAQGTDGSVTINGSAAVVQGLNASVRTGSLAIDLALTSNFAGDPTNPTQTSSFEILGGGAVFSISPAVGLAGQESVGVKDVGTGNLGSVGAGFLSSLGSGQANGLASKNFTVAQRIVREAIDQVSSLRGRLGAFQKNTLRTTINSLHVAKENVTSAESAIRDSDFAMETSNLTRSQILVQSSTMTLQLANAQPQNVLALIG
jgi:flagellin